MKRLGMVSCALASVLTAGLLFLMPTVALADDGTELAAGSAGVSAQGLQTQAAKYDVWVGGHRVTSANKNNIPIAIGKASYNPTTHTLTLKNAKITKGDTWSNSSGDFTYLALGSEVWFERTGTGPACGYVNVRVKYKGCEDACQVKVKNSYLALAS